VTPLPSRTRAGVALLGLLACVAATAACGDAPAPHALPPAPAELAVSPLPAGTDGTVRRVVDGDTLVVDALRVRLIGVDTPETVKPDSPIECYGPEASAATKALLPAGTRVRLVSDVEKQDRYGRELRYVYRVGDGLFVEGYLAREGFAKPLSIPPNVAHRTEIARWSAQAARERLGLWGSCEH